MRGDEYEVGSITDATWVYRRDHLALLSESGTARLDRGQWRLIAGSFGHEPGLAAGVYAPSDPSPIYQLPTEFGDREYYCAC